MLTMLLVLKNIFLRGTSRIKRGYFFCAGAALLSLAGPSWSAVTFVASSSSNAGGGSVNQLTLSAPVGMAAGDVMLALVAQNTSCTPLIGSPSAGVCAAGAAPAGWALLQNPSNSGTLGSLAYFKLAAAADLGASFSWTTQGSGRSSASIAAFRGVNPSAPIDSSSARSNNASKLVSAPSVGATSANAMVVALFASKNGNQSTSPPPGMAEIASVGTSAGGNGVWIESAFSVQALAGATGIKTASFSAAAISTGIVVVLNAALTGPDHYELSLPSGAQSCSGVTAILRACATSGAPCTTPYTGVAGTSASLTSTGATLGAASVTFDASGVASTSLSYPSAANGAIATVTIAATAQPPTGANQCCTNGSACTPSNTCSVAFSTSGFIVSSAAGGASYTVPSQTAGASSASNTGTLFLRAVKTASSTQACEAALVGANTINWSVQCSNPSACAAGSLMSLSGNASTAAGSRPIATGSTPSTPISLTFDANGNAPFSFNYADVGQVSLFASKPAAGAAAAISGGTNAFVVKPAGFSLSAIKCTALSTGNCAAALVSASNPNNPAASSAAGAAFIQAGSDFSATVTATIIGGAAAPNYGKEIRPESVNLTSSRVLPLSGGAAPMLTNSAAFGAFSAGSATATTLQWDEVGIITLSPAVASGSYLGAGNVVGATSANVGRFIPESFSSTPLARCASGTAFTYSGQPFALSITARNASGATTFNYDASSGLSRATSLTAQGALSGALSSSTVAASDFTAGTATFTASTGPSYTYSSKKTGPSTLTIRALDIDRVTSDPVFGGAEDPALLRSGQLRLYGASGGDQSALVVPLALQYWSGSAWVTNADDTCSAFSSASVALTGQSNAMATYSASAPALAFGTGFVSVTPSSAAGSAAGTLGLAINLGKAGADQSCQAGHGGSASGQPWLRSFFGNCSPNADRDPSASLGFGIYSGEAKRQIYIREMR